MCVEAKSEERLADQTETALFGYQLAVEKLLDNEYVQDNLHF